MKDSDCELNLADQKTRCTLNEVTLHRQWRPDIMVQYSLQHVTAPRTSSKQRQAIEKPLPSPELLACFEKGLTSSELLSCFAAESTEGDMDPPK